MVRKLFVMLIIMTKKTKSKTQKLPKKSMKNLKNFLIKLENILEKPLKNNPKRFPNHKNHHHFVTK
jgi:mRNA-degrading endonuclease RelE of RelBE toxin-antitoxin system